MKLPRYVYHGRLKLFGQMSVFLWAWKFHMEVGWAKSNLLERQIVVKNKKKIKLLQHLCLLKV